MTTTTAPTVLISDRKAVTRQAEFSMVQATDGNTTTVAGRLRFPPNCSREAIRELIAMLRAEAATVLNQKYVGNESQTTGWSTLVFHAPLPVYQELSRVAAPSNLRVVRDSTKQAISLLESEARAASTTAQTSSNEAESAPVAETIGPETDEAEAVETEAAEIGEAATVEVDSEAVEIEALVEDACTVGWSTLIPATSLQVCQELAEPAEAEPETEITAVREATDGAEATEVTVEALTAETAVEPQGLATVEQLQQLTLAKLKELAGLHEVRGRSSMTKNLETAHQLLLPKLVGLVAVAEL